MTSDEVGTRRRRSAVRVLCERVGGERRKPKKEENLVAAEPTPSSAERKETKRSGGITHIWINAFVFNRSWAELSRAEKEKGHSSAVGRTARKERPRPSVFSFFFKRLVSRRQAFATHSLLEEEEEEEGLFSLVRREEEREKRNV